MDATEEQLANLARTVSENGDAFARLTSTLHGQSAAQLEATKVDKDAKIAAADFSAKLNASSAAASALANVFVSYNKEIYKSGNANKAAIASIDSLADAAKYAGIALALFTPGGPLIKAAVAGLGMLASVLLSSSKVIAEQTDDIYKAYQDMARAGAAGAGGMQDVFDSLQKVGMGTEKFGAYLKLVNENANDLATFGGTVNKGRKIFENTMSSMDTAQRVRMEQMGLDREAQAEATMAYIKQQRLLTQGTKTQMDTSSTAVMKYIQETDTLARITGLNRKEQEKIHDDAMRIESYNATMQEIRETQGEAGVRRVQEAAAMAAKAGPETLKQFQSSLSGFVGSSDEAQQAFMATGGKISEVTDGLRSGQYKNTRDTAEAMNGLLKAYGDTAQQFRGQAKMNNFGKGGMGNFYEAIKAGSISLEDLTKAFDEAEDERKKQLADPKTKQLAEAMNAAVDQQLISQKLVNNGMGVYIAGLSTVSTANGSLLTSIQNLTTALTPLIKQISDFAGTNVLPALTKTITGIANIITAETTEQKIAASGKAGLAETAGKVGGAYAGMEAGAAIGAGFGAAFGGVGAVPGSIVGGALGATAGYFGGGALGRAADASVSPPPVDIVKIDKEIARFTKGNNMRLQANMEYVAKLQTQKESATPGGAVAPRGTATASTGAAQAGSSQDDLKNLGLNIKTGDVQAPGATISPNLIELAKNIQGNVPGFNYFSGFNDKFHQENASGSRHTQGLAADFTLAKPPSKEEGDTITAQLKSLGASFVQNEYANPSSKATEGHFHVEIPKFEHGGNLSGIGLVGEKGPELAVGSANISSNNDVMRVFKDLLEEMSKQTSILREITTATHNSSSAAEKMLRYAQN